MSNLRLVEEVGAPANRVRRLALDIENTPKLFSQIVSIEMLASPKDAEGLAAVGTRWRETRRAGFGTARVDLEITAADEDGSFVVSCTAMGASFDTRFSFVPLDDRRCRVLMDVRITASGLISGVMAWLMRGAMAKGLRQDLDSLKRAAEAA